MESKATPALREHDEMILLAAQIEYLTGSELVASHEGVESGPVQCHEHWCGRRSRTFGWFIGNPRELSFGAVDIRNQIFDLTSTIHNERHGLPIDSYEKVGCRFRQQFHWKLSGHFRKESIALTANAHEIVGCEPVLPSIRVINSVIERRDRWSLAHLPITVEQQVHQGINPATSR